MKTLLIPTDFSDVAYTAAQYGVDLAIYLHMDHLIFYNSYKLHAVDADLASRDDEGNIYREASLKHLRKMYDKLYIPEGNQLSIQFHADNLSVKEGVEKLVSECGVSLIVMGIAGRSDIENTLIGSNTIAVGAGGSAPLLIVPRETLFHPIHKVAYASDLRKVEETTPAESIFKICESLEAELHILYADYAGKNFDVQASFSQKKLLDYFRKLHPQFHIVADQKDPAQGISDYVRNNKIGLVVLASRNYGFVERIFHSSFSKKLLNLADVPVVIIKNKAAFL